MREFVVAMENQPGRLASLTEALAAFNVNIEALAAHGHDGDATVRLITDDEATTRRVLHEASLRHFENTVLTAQLPHRPGELARLTRALADAGVNIEAVYVLALEQGGGGVRRGRRPARVCPSPPPGRWRRVVGMIHA